MLAGHKGDRQVAVPWRLVEVWIDTHVLNFKRTSVERSAEEGILLMSGSDDLLLQKTFSPFHKEGLGMVFFANLGSMGGLTSLRRGLCHIGTCHLLQDDAEEYNFAFAAEELDLAPVIVNFSKREQGILLQKGNPKGITCVADLAKKGVRIVNRQLRSGARLLLDYEIARSQISIHAIGRLSMRSGAAHGGRNGCPERQSRCRSGHQGGGRCYYRDCQQGAPQTR